MKKIILFLFIVVGFSGCQQALNDFNKSLAEFEQNLNQNIITNDSVSKSNSLSEDNNYKKEYNLNETSVDVENLKPLSEEEFYNEYDQYYLGWSKMLEKYAVKNTESLSSIETKYKNSEKLFQELLRDAKILELKFNNLQAYRYSSYRNSNKFANRYSLSKTTEIETPYVYGFTAYNTNLEKYQNYLKTAYSTYNSRQQSIAKKIEEKKVENEEKNKLLEQEKQIQKDRDKVKLVCEKWLKKAKQDVYSLGVGEKIVIMRNGKAVSTIGITKVERNTFLVGTYTLWNTYETFYVQKSDSIPYESLKTAPSPYCYQ